MSRTENDDHGGGPPRRRVSARAMAAACATAVVVVLGMASATSAQTGGVGASLYSLLESYRRPSSAPSPADNPTTAAKVELGKALFFDPRLSGSGAISCASCHNPALGWQDGLAKGVGDHGGELARRTPTILNTAWAEPLFWDGRAGTLEDQAKGPLASSKEMNLPHAQVVARVASIDGYVRAFETAFPGKPIDIDTVVQAIAAYERTIVSNKAPFDRWVDGDEAAVSDSAKRGFALFNGKAECASCHSGWRMTDDGFHDIGLPDTDMGRAAVFPGLVILEHAFKTPTLRNIAERAPYMHDGSLPSLEAVVDHYDHGFVKRTSLASQMRPLNLTAQDRQDLVAFLRTLSSEDDKVTLPNLPR